MNSNRLKRHPDIGADIVGQLGLWDKERQIIRHHHERFNGKGYPDGLGGSDIPILARILSVADVYDAMASDRTYRSKMDKNTVCDIICSDAGKRFDPKVVVIFRKLFQAGKLLNIENSSSNR